jgi:type IV pilus biogenesis protein CpaD/CtpE
MLGVLLQGCSSTPRFNDHFGASVRANLAAQVIEPAAAANTNPVHGVDGTAALAAQERYQRSFKETDPGASQPLITVGRAK